MVSKKEKFISITILFLLLSLSLLRYVDSYLFSKNEFVDALSFVVNGVVCTGILAYWATTIHRRVMHKGIRNYLIAFAVLSIFWLTVRNMKWRVFEHQCFEARLMWYMFYIPMILFPLISFFIALSMDKEEKYKLDKKWNFLVVIAVFLILIVLTNDMHQLVFVFLPNFENWDSNYSYQFCYDLIMLFIAFVVTCAATILFKKWRKINRTKRAYSPLLVISFGALYIIVYIVNRPLASIFMDMTTFTCMIYILFWESCIQIGMICSNSKHKEFFEHSKVAAQILEENGRVNLTSSQTVGISTNEFISLKEKVSITSENVVLNIAPISSCYVVWTKDISKLNNMNQELVDLRDELYGEVTFLDEERKLKEEHARIQKLNNLYDLISKEIFPQVDKIENLIKKDNIEDEIAQDTVLKQITLTSCYAKRKTNLLLQIDSGKSITNADMINCYNESFRGLGLFGTGCDIKYNPPIATSGEIHMLCYDLFQEILEKTGFSLEMIFVNCMEDEKNLRFSIEISQQNYISQDSFICFKQAKLKKLGGALKIYQDDDSITILMLFPKNKEVA